MRSMERKDHRRVYSSRVDSLIANELLEPRFISLNSLAPLTKVNTISVCRLPFSALTPAKRINKLKKVRTNAN